MKKENVENKRTFMYNGVEREYTLPEETICALQELAETYREVQEDMRQEGYEIIDGKRQKIKDKT